MTNTTYRVKGMTCPHCVKTVTKILRQINGIQSVEVTLEPPLAKLQSKQHIPLETLNKELEEMTIYQLEEVENALS
jgi:copper chaperone CopZ